MPDSEIQWLHPDGAGGALDDRRRVLSVPGALPGDLVRWTATSEQARRVDGTLDEILRPSPSRRTPTCPHDRDCGGCDLAALQPGARLEQLARSVQRALQLDAPPPVEADDEPHGQRARIKLTVREGVLGYLGARSHDLLPIETCEIAHPALLNALPRLRAFVHEHPDPAFDAIELRTDGNLVALDVHTRGRLSPATRAALAELAPVAVDGADLHGDTTLHLPHLDGVITASGGSFFQVHLTLNQRLVRHVRDQLLAVSPERVLDLYAGIGNLGLPLAQAGLPVLAVERDGTSARDLEKNARRLGLTRLTVRRSPVEQLDLSREAFDAAVLDPPRQGAGEVLARVLRNRPRRVVYVACHVLAAARDLRAVAKQGYRLTEVRCFDLFPQTHHLETVITLDRPSR